MFNPRLIKYDLFEVFCNLDLLSVPVTTLNFPI